MSALPFAVIAGSTAAGLILVATSRSRGWRLVAATTVAGTVVGALAQFALQPEVPVSLYGIWSGAVYAIVVGVFVALGAGRWRSSAPAARR